MGLQFSSVRARVAGKCDWTRQVTMTVWPKATIAEAKTLADVASPLAGIVSCHCRYKVDSYRPGKEHRQHFVRSVFQAKTY